MVTEPLLVEIWVKPIFEKDRAKKNYYIKTFRKFRKDNKSKKYIFRKK